MTFSGTPSKSLAELGLEPGVLIPRGWGGGVEGRPGLGLSETRPEGIWVLFQVSDCGKKMFKLDWQVQSFLPSTFYFGKF